MDLSPGTSTLPPSRLGGRTRIFIAACSSEIRPDLAYALELALDAGAVAGAKHPLQIAERRAESRNGLGQRVVSLKPRAATSRNCGSIRTTASTSASATRCGRWLMAATARSWVAGSIVTTRPPAASQNSVTRFTASGEVRSVGVRMIVAPRKRSALETAKPERL